MRRAINGAEDTAIAAEGLFSEMEPTTLKEALSGAEANHWARAINNKLDSLEKNGT